ncbi:hypothetical protein C8J57DRAFT_1221311 [Mycena rebaudengoi]|nr:hypothetical protein C8J57DRAFT_1221311 [Mycena rebaudengoi]
MFTLLAFATLASFRVSRPYLDRVSFRLLIYALVGNLIFMTFIAGTPLGSPGKPIGSAACSFVAFTSTFGLLFSASMFAAMALNLVLVLVFEVNGQKMEKYYILDAFILCAICSIVPYAAGRYGWEVFCVPLRRTDTGILGAELGAFLLVIVHMLRYQRASKLAHGNARTAIPPLIMYRRLILRIGESTEFAIYGLLITTGISQTTTPPAGLLHHTPIVPDIYPALTGRLKTPQNQRLVQLSSTLFALRQVFYALLALTDPSFIRALSALLKRPTPRSGTSQQALAVPPQERASTETALSKDSEAGNTTAPEPELDITAQI